MSTWKCYNMPCYVSWAPTPWYGQLGVFIASPTIIVVGQKQQFFVDGRTGQSGAHQICTVHCLVPYHVNRPLGSVAVDRWIWPLPRLSGVHRTVQCYSRGRLNQYNLVSQISHWILEIHHLVWVRVITPVEHKSYCPSDSETTTISHIREMLFTKK
jgi:hypothetical protein